MNRSSHLKLIDDPSAGVIWILRQLPLEVSASYLALLLAHAIEHKTISAQDRARISELLESILSDHSYRVA